MQSAAFVWNEQKSDYLEQTMPVLSWMHFTRVRGFSGYQRAEIGSQVMESFEIQPLNLIFSTAPHYELTNIPTETSGV